MVNRVVKAAGIVGSVYCIHNYISDRIRDIQASANAQRNGTENLKKRFSQNQEAILYSVMTLLPTLSDQILSSMDIHSLTVHLKSLTNPPSLASSSILSDSHDAGSDAASSIPDSVFSAASSIPSDSPPSHPAPSPPSVISHPESSTSVSHPFEFPSSSSSAAHTLPKTKAELWNELKMLTITRTLTTIYSVSIFTLLTTIQLTLLARLKYVASIRQAEREERMKEQLQSRLSITNLLLSRVPVLDGIFDGSLDAMEDQEDLDFDLTDQDEKKFLTMSWWILHVGWKDIGERVRRAVEEVFDGVSLKTKLAPIDIHRLIHDVRRRVEHEITFEGREKRADLFSTVLPPTQETLQLVLNQSGFASSSAQDPSPYITFDATTRPLIDTSGEYPMFDTLFSETRQWLLSADFTVVLEACVDRASEIFLENLDQSIFPSVPHEESPRRRLAASLPGLAHWSELALTSLPNELVDNLLEVPQLAIFQAIIWGEISAVAE